MHTSLRRTSPSCLCLPSGGILGVKTHTPSVLALTPHQFSLRLWCFLPGSTLSPCTLEWEGSLHAAGTSLDLRARWSLSGCGNSICRGANALQFTLHTTTTTTKRQTQLLLQRLWGLLERIHGALHNLTPMWFILSSNLCAHSVAAEHLAHPWAHSKNSQYLAPSNTHLPETTSPVQPRTGTDIAHPRHPHRPCPSQTPTTLIPSLSELAFTVVFALAPRQCWLRPRLTSSFSVCSTVPLAEDTGVCLMNECTNSHKACASPHPRLLPFSWRPSQLVTFAGLCLPS